MNMNLKKWFIITTIFACNFLCLQCQPGEKNREVASAQQVVANKQCSDVLLLTLERIDFNRIAMHQVEYGKQLNRFSLFNKILYAAIGTAILGGGAFLFWRLNRSVPKEESKSATVSPDINKDSALAQLAVEKLKQEKEKATFLGAVKFGAKDAVKTSIYSFLMLLFYERFLHLGENVNFRVSQLIGKGSAELLKDNEEATQKITHSFSEIVNEYMHTCACVAHEPHNLVATEYKCFLENELKNQHAVLMHTIENLIAFFTVALEHKNKNKEKKVEENGYFNNQVMSFIGFANCYADDFQKFLNTHDEADRSAQEAQINLLNRELFLRIARFMQMGIELFA